MTDRNDKAQSGQTPPSDAWQEVGRQFQILGESLAAAFRASWHEPENRKRVQAMQENLERMVKDVDAAITDAAASPHAQQARAEAKRTVESLRQASEETIQDMRPHLLAALQQVNEELRQLVGRMEGRSEPQPAAGPQDEQAAPSGAATGQEDRP